MPPAAAPARARKAAPARRGPKILVARERLLTKLNTMAERMIAARKSAA